MRPMGLPLSRTIESSRWAVAGERSRSISQSESHGPERLRGRRPEKSPGTAAHPWAYSQAHSPDPRQKDTIGLCQKNCEARARMKYIPGIHGLSPFPPTSPPLRLCRAGMCERPGPRLQRRACQTDAPRIASQPPQIIAAAPHITIAATRSQPWGGFICRTYPPRRPNAF
jgi:hypothetical protein